MIYKVDLLLLCGFFTVHEDVCVEGRPGTQRSKQQGCPQRQTTGGAGAGNSFTSWWEKATGPRLGGGHEAPWVTNLTRHPLSQAA